MPATPWIPLTLLLLAGSLSGAESVRISFPLQGRLNVDYMIRHYKGHDSGTKDYMGGNYCHDHRGTDWGVWDYRMMDRGMLLLAPFDGTVGVAGDGIKDWNITARDGQAGGDGNDLSFIPLPETGQTAASYMHHVRYRGIFVQKGESVRRGQPVALMGSTETVSPHVHFDGIGRDEVFVGTYKAGSLRCHWEWQQPYRPDLPLTVLSCMPYLDEGDMRFGDHKDWAATADLHGPAVFARNTTGIRVWLRLQGRKGDPWSLDLIKPDGSLYQTLNGTQSMDTSDAWQYQRPTFNLNGLRAAQSSIQS